MAKWDEFEEEGAVSTQPVGDRAYGQPVPGAGGGGGSEADALAYIRRRQQELADSWGPQAVEQIYNELKAMGYDVERPTHDQGRKISQDKLVLPGGSVWDMVGDVGGDNSIVLDQHGYWVDGQPSTTPGYVTPFPDSGGGMGSLPPGYTIGDLYNGGQYPYSPVGAPGLNAPWSIPFTAPNITDDPGYKFRRDQTQQAAERGASARGTMMTGGFQKDLAGYISDLASQEYNAAWNRDRQQYLDAYGIYRTNRQDIYNNLMGYAQPGLAAAGGMANANAGYSNAASGFETDRANAEAAGQAAQGQHWNDAIVAASQLWDQFDRDGGDGQDINGEPIG